MYDFMVFGYYAAAIGRTFFPKVSEFATLRLSLATLAYTTFIAVRFATVAQWPQCDSY